MNFLSPGQLGRWLADRTHIWQMPLLDQHSFAGFIKDRDLSFSFGSDIEELWKVGLLKADLVQTDCELEIPGLELVHTRGEDGYIYLDARDGIPCNGLTDSYASVPVLPCKITLRFHPFRYLVLYQVEQILKPNIHPKQQLLYAAGYLTLLKKWQQHFDVWTKGENFRTVLRKWENIAELAIATEPCFYGRLFGITRQHDGIDADISTHWNELRYYYEQIGQSEIEEARKEICIAAETLDPNKTVHNILRLTAGESRIKNVRGRLGGSLLLLTMAEMLRRAAEDVFNVELPEEDELGFGIVFRDARRELYGSHRLFDGNRQVANEFLRQHGLDYRVRVRWYFEGETEYYAVESVLGDFSAIELINLRGRVAERGAVAFRDSLRRDMADGVFSWVSIDGDREEYVRAVRKAAQDDEICGMFYVADPDFEFANFTLDELEAILWEFALENGVEDLSKRIGLHQAIQSAKSGEELLRFARKSLLELSHVSKGAEWGKRLMKYALEHPDAPLSDPTMRQFRPVLDALQWAIHATVANYKLSREKYRVDPNTGRPVPR